MFGNACNDWKTLEKVLYMLHIHTQLKLSALNKKWFSIHFLWRCQDKDLTSYNFLSIELFICQKNQSEIANILWNCGKRCCFSQNACNINGSGSLQSFFIILKTVSLKMMTDKWLRSIVTVSRRLRFER